MKLNLVISSVLVLLLGYQVHASFQATQPPAAVPAALAPAPEPSMDPARVEKDLSRAEDALIRYLSAPGRPRDLLLEAHRAFQPLQRVGQYDPRLAHVGLCIAYTSRELGEGDPRSPWLRAGLDYMFSTLDPVEALVRVRRERREGYYDDEALHQLASGLFSQGRQQQLVQLVSDFVDPGDLHGRSVADVGCGPGQLAAALTDLVGEEGRVYGVDIAPSVQTLAGLAARHDPRFGRFQFVLGGPRDVGLPRDSVDYLFLMDVHFAGGRPGMEQDLRSRVLPWLATIRNSLRPGGKVFVYESDDGDPPKDFAFEILRRAGFSDVQAVERGSGVRLVRSYLIRATR